MSTILKKDFLLQNLFLQRVPQMNQNGVFGKMVWDPANANGEQEIRTEIKRLTYESGRESESKVVSCRVIIVFTFSSITYLNHGM